MKGLGYMAFKKEQTPLFMMKLLVEPQNVTELIYSFV